MTPDELLSPFEHKLFFGIAFLICCLFFINLANINIERYNRTIEIEQFEKRDFANNAEKISFSMCSFGSPRIYVLILELQFFTNPLLLLLFLKRRFGTFIFSVLLAAFTFFGYVGWMIDSYDARKANRFFNIEEASLHTYLLYNSTVLEFILFLSFAVLLILQAVVLKRFVIEKFQARIYLR